MSYAMFIDDERDPLDVKWGTWEEQAMYRDGDWIVARDWPEVIDLITSLGMPSLISFDHDLGENKATGFDIAKHIVNMSLDGNTKYTFPDDFKYMVHSKNPVGANNIRFYLQGYFAMMNESIEIKNNDQVDARFRCSEGIVE